MICRADVCHHADDRCSSHPHHSPGWPGQAAARDQRDKSSSLSPTAVCWLAHTSALAQEAPSCDLQQGAPRSSSSTAPSPSCPAGPQGTTCPRKKAAKQAEQLFEGTVFFNKVYKVVQLPTRGAAHLSRRWSARPAPRRRRAPAGGEGHKHDTAPAAPAASPPCPPHAVPPAGPTLCPPGWLPTPGPSRATAPHTRPTRTPH